MIVQKHDRRDINRSSGYEGTRNVSDQKSDREDPCLLSIKSHDVFSTIEAKSDLDDRSLGRAFLVVW